MSLAFLSMNPDARSDLAFFFKLFDSVFNAACGLFVMTEHALVPYPFGGKFKTQLLEYLTSIDNLL